MAQEKQESPATEPEEKDEAPEQQTEAPAAQESGPPQQEEAPQAQEDQAPQEEPPEQPVKRRKNLWSRLLLNVLYFLLLLGVLFEAVMGFLWWRVNALQAQQAEQAEQPAQRTVSSAAYANQDGSYWPEDWPDAVAVHILKPPLAPSGEPAEDGAEPAP